MVGAGTTQLWAQGWPWGIWVEGKSLGAPTVDRRGSQVQNFIWHGRPLLDAQEVLLEGLGLLDEAERVSAMSRHKREAHTPEAGGLARLVMSIFTLFLTPFLSPVQGVVKIRKQRVEISPHSVFPVPAAPLNYNPLLNPKGLYTSCPPPTPRQSLLSQN